MTASLYQSGPGRADAAVEGLGRRGISRSRLIHPGRRCPPCLPSPLAWDSRKRGGIRMKRVLALLLAAASVVWCKKEQATAAKAQEVLSEFTKAGANHEALYKALRPKAEDYEAVF